MSDLTREQRAWFDPDPRAERDAEDDLRDRLADAVAERAYACLGRQVR